MKFKSTLNFAEVYRLVEGSPARFALTAISKKHTRSVLLSGALSMVRPPDLSFETLARFFAHVKTLKPKLRHKALTKMVQDNLDNNSAFLFDFYRLLLPPVFLGPPILLAS